MELGFEHAKMNYQMLGKSVPHLHAHIVPRPLDAGVDLRDVQTAARHAGPCTTMRYCAAPEILVVRFAGR